MGLLVNPAQLLEIAPAAFATAAALTFIARPAAVYLCLAGFRMPWADKVFISWVGLRGAVPIVLSMFPLMAGLPHAILFFNVAFFVVMVSLILQGWTITPLARRLGLVIPPARGPLQRVDLDAPRHADFQLIVYRITGDSPAADTAPDDLSLGEDVRITGVARGERLLRSQEVQKFEPDDRIYLIAPGKKTESLNKLFAAQPQSRELARRVFFGDFTVSGDAQLAEVAALYGAPLPEDPGTASVAEYFAHTFNGQPVVGDRLTLGNIDLVIREMAGDRITQMGLVFHPHAGGPDAMKG
jgi:cell volume regulation protein A